MLSPRASVSNPAEKSYSQDMLSVKPMVMSVLEPHKHRDQPLLWALLGSNKSKPRTQQTQSAAPHRENQCWGFKPRAEGQGTHLSSEHSHRHGEEPPTSAFLLDWGCLHQTAKFSKLLVESRANQSKQEISRTRPHSTEGPVRKVLPQTFITECDCSPTPPGKTLQTVPKEREELHVLSALSVAIHLSSEKTKLRASCQTAEIRGSKNSSQNCTFHLNGCDLNHETEEWRKAQLFF